MIQNFKKKKQIKKTAFQNLLEKKHQKCILFQNLLEKTEKNVYYAVFFTISHFC